MPDVSIEEDKAWLLGTLCLTIPLPTRHWRAYLLISSTAFVITPSEIISLRCRTLYWWLVRVTVGSPSVNSGSHCVPPLVQHLELWSAFTSSGSQCSRSSQPRSFPDSQGHGRVREAGELRGCAGEQRCCTTQGGSGRMPQGRLLLKRLPRGR